MGMGKRFNWKKKTPPSGVGKAEFLAERQSEGVTNNHINIQNICQR